MESRLFNVRKGDTVTVRMYLSTLVYPNVRRVERYAIGTTRFVDITDEDGHTFSGDAFRAVEIEPASPRVSS